MPVAESMKSRKRPQPVLTHDEEQVLEDWLVEMASIGYAGQNSSYSTQ